MEIEIRLTIEGFKKSVLNHILIRAIEYAQKKSGRTWDNNRQCLDFYDKASEYFHAGLIAANDIKKIVEE